MNISWSQSSQSHQAQMFPGQGRSSIPCVKLLLNQRQCDNKKDWTVAQWSYVLLSHDKYFFTFHL